MTEKFDMPITQTHINTLQNIIARLSSYSMSCKTWAVTMVAALCVILVDSQNTKCSYIIFAPIIVFWFFDCYYLGLEKVFRNNYNDFLKSLDTETDIRDDMCFSLKVRRFGYCFIKAMFSPSTTLLYGMLALIVVLLYIAVK